MVYAALILSMGFAFLIALFAIQNSMIVYVNLMMWSIETSLVLVILGAASLGFLMALSLQFYPHMKLRYQLYKVRADLKLSEDKLLLAQQAASLQEVKIPVPPQDTLPLNK